MERVKWSSDLHRFTHATYAERNAVNCVNFSSLAKIYPKLCDLLLPNEIHFFEVSDAQRCSRCVVACLARLLCEVFKLQRSQSNEEAKNTPFD